MKLQFALLFPKLTKQQEKGCAGAEAEADEPGATATAKAVGKSGWSQRAWRPSLTVIDSRGVLRETPRPLRRRFLLVSSTLHLAKQQMALAQTGPRPTLAARLGLFDATMLVMGGIVGSGIFINPYVVAGLVHTPR